MSTRFNEKQATQLASFIFDVAKGFLLGGIGFAITGTLEQKILFPFLGVFVSLGLVRMALSLLNEKL